MSEPSEYQDPQQGFIAHLIELRDRLLRIVLGVLLIFIVLFPFANDIYVAISEPLRAMLPEGSQMIAIDVASPFLTPFKLALVLSIFLSVPWTLHQLWGFVSPGLYSHEKRLAVPLLASSTALFYMGMAFAYFVVFPLVFGFLVGTTPDGVAMMTDIGRYLDFVLTLFFAFGVAFEVPIATFLLVISGVTTADSLVEKRPYIIVGAFVIGMFLTPPDVISQTLLALPMWLLFEVGIIFARLAKRDDKNEDENEGPNTNEENSIAPKGTLAAATAGAGTVVVGQELAPNMDDWEEMDPADDDDDGWDGVDDEDDDEETESTDADNKLPEDVEQPTPEVYDTDEGEWRPMTEEEMDAELDAIEEDDDELEDEEPKDEVADEQADADKPASESEPTKDKD